MITGILFDKDGTLYDFQASWSRWAIDMLHELAGGDPVQAAELGLRIGFDIGAGRFQPDSVAVAGTLEETARALLPGLPELGFETLYRHLEETAANTQMAEVVPLAAFLAGLKARGLCLGVATNDAEVPARAHLTASGVEAMFDYIAGADSGYGTKPEPGMCLGFAEATGLPPCNVLMVGDSRHDLSAAKSAGMIGMGVLTGLASRGDLADLAHVVLPDISHIPTWLEDHGGTDTPAGRQNTTRSVAI
ncbi:HAD family hydrolase [Rhodophyticola sp. CCM32]|uniref:HAD family hydrolase n=1 Tax=Rhodophyticola sp. CCM32 TaxID=2916397 RepID=UPI00107F7000|nr:HAD family hydrolase [Rhodophyticola sp. CCM32]QBY01412.1 HAD family hydrolase [Rhodophyticola sp. CCM32]